MFSNFTKWDVLTAASEVERSHDSDPPTPGLIEGLSGAAAVILFLIGIAIAVRKNLEAFRGVLEQLQDILTTYFLSGFLFRVRVGVRDGVGDGFRVRVRARWGQGFIHHNPNLLELKLRPSGKTQKKQKIRIRLEKISQIRTCFWYIMVLLAS